ncbi:hypothetical protein KIM372_14110 [Bombiscardovia nodaiensis]|uniref:Mutator family transposase n=1 Tax=Bombiscardovia nodaiensis TaxID=2932181 RepID=A0ABM8B9L0_9BIFI|nr:hypothetical protein KIM372_14110 [Bombiscardovia nodaiensis]
MPPVPLVQDHYDVVQVDGIWLHRKAVVLIAVADAHVIGWRVARSETSLAWSLLMERIAAPRVLACDGGGGIAKAVRQVWPTTAMQRCLFHISMNVTALTSMNPKLKAGKELKHLAIRLSQVKSEEDLRQWLVAYNAWETTWHEWLKTQSTYKDGSEADKHQRLVKARNLLNKRIREGTMNTFITQANHCDSPIPTTNNLLESWNKQLRAMLKKPQRLEPGTCNQSHLLVVPPTHTRTRK